MGETVCEIVDWPLDNGRIAVSCGVRIRVNKQVMKLNQAVWIGIGGLVVLFALFEVRVNFQFTMPGEKRELDAGQEARYAACYAGRDKEIHAVAFGTIDNPDVQKLYILNSRERAATECRQHFPEQYITVKEPFRFNLLDLHRRF